MEWLKKLLEAQGLSEAQIKAITEGVESNYKGWVPQHRFEEINTAKKKAEDDLKERDQQLADLKKAAGDNAALKEQIEKLQADNKAAADKYAADMQELKTNTAVKLALSGKVHDPDLLLGLLDKSKIKLAEDGSIAEGLDDQIKSLRESKAFLFVSDNDGRPKFRGTNPAEGSDKGGDGTPENGLGKRLADQSAKSNEVLEKARDSYFQ